MQQIYINRENSIQYKILLCAGLKTVDAGFVLFIYDCNYHFNNPLLMNLLLFIKVLVDSWEQFIVWRGLVTVFISCCSAFGLGGEVGFYFYYHFLPFPILFFSFFLFFLSFSFFSFLLLFFFFLFFPPERISDSPLKAF